MKYRALRIFSLAFATLGAAVAFAQEGFEFMPDGGKTILVRLLDDPETCVPDIREMAETEFSREEWTEYFQVKAPDLSNTELQTLAGYVSINFPLEPEALENLEIADDITLALPIDGMELSMNHCQFCHSFFTGYLVQDRDEVGWLGTFKAPFHTEIKMTQKERETFALYSAINMPMKFEDVPEELRF